jgi:hypothetical protein
MPYVTMVQPTRFTESKWGPSARLAQPHEKADVFSTYYKPTYQEGNDPGWSWCGDFVSAESAFIWADLFSMAPKAMLASRPASNGYRWPGTQLGARS